MKIVLTIFSLLLSLEIFGFHIDSESIVDSRGNRIEKKVYDKIVVIDPAVVEGFYLIGGEDRIAAIGQLANSEIWPKEKTAKLPTVGNMLKPSVEQVISFTPDLVILNQVSSSFEDSLKERGIKVLINEGKNFQEILDNLDVYGIVTGRESAAAEVKKNYLERLNRIEREIAVKPIEQRGVFLFTTSPMMAFSQDSLPGEIFKVLGIENLSKSLYGKRAILSPEFLIKSDPQIIVGSMGVQSPDDILRMVPIVKETSAGKNRNIKVVSSEKVLRATPRVIDALEELYLEIANGK